MDFSSWFRRTASKGSKSSKTPCSNQQQEDKEELLLLGVTDELINHVKSFTLDTFKSFPLDDEKDTYDMEAATTSTGNVRKDLSDWQERHAFLVLSKVKELAQLRFKLCPARLKEQQFWRIYFVLVRNYVAEYELQAIRLAKLKKMASETEKTSDTTVYEVEMAETKQEASLSPPAP